MAILTEDMQLVVTQQRLGFVATVDVDGSPDVSPKGNFIVLDCSRAVASIGNERVAERLAENQVSAGRGRRPSLSSPARPR